jgi:hypothetical protein
MTEMEWKDDRVRIERGRSGNGKRPEWEWKDDGVGMERRQSGN